MSRENRFVVRARLASGEEVRAHLANTARLGDILAPGVEVVLQPATTPRRLTRWSVTRVWDGTWVALEANTAADLVVDHLRGGGALDGWPPVTGLRREVTRDGHRFDVEVDHADGRVGVVEVKSLSRAVDGVAPLSWTPSTRGAAHLAALGRLTADGVPCAAVFVVQRGDVEALDIGAPADPAWVAAVRAARAAGVAVTAWSCTVTPADIRLARQLPVRDG